MPRSVGPATPPISNGMSATGVGVVSAGSLSLVGSCVAVAGFSDVAVTGDSVVVGAVEVDVHAGGSVAAGASVD
jgi:hypothetical protein